VDIVNNPGAPSTGGGKAPAPAPAPSTTAISAPPAQTSAAPPAQTSAAPSTGGGGSNADFKLANGQAAQSLNAKFSTLTSSSPCTAGENACVGGSFAQCVGGKFVATSCGAAPLTCAALPLVNSKGTSVTCTTKADAEARIAATGAKGGLTGSGGGGGDGAATPAQPAKTNVGAQPAPTPAAPQTGGGFQLQNGKDAQALNAQFASLTPTSPCTAGQNACVNGGFAQCVNGKFAVTQCAGGLKCAALPLVNSKGTSITCTTEADAVARIGRTGAKGGLTG